MVCVGVAAGRVIVGAGFKTASVGVAEAAIDLSGSDAPALGVGGGTGDTEVGLPFLMTHCRSMSERSPKLSARIALVLKRMFAPFGFSTRIYSDSFADQDMD